MARPKKKPKTRPVEVQGTGGLRGVIRVPEGVKVVTEQKPEGASPRDR